MLGVSLPHRQIPNLLLAVLPLQELKLKAVLQQQVLMLAQERVQILIQKLDQVPAQKQVVELAQERIW